jgi:two-component system, NtrC family, response regulator AtoC
MIGPGSQGALDVRVLLIEDDEVVAELFGKTLEEDGHETAICHTGAAGLASIWNSPPDVVFLDVRMPEMNGIEVLRVIRSISRSLPVILVTGHATRGEIEQARRLGVTEIVQKPFVFNEYAAALTRIAGRQPD